MTKLTRKNGAEISPCIIAQIRYLLGVSTSKPTNKNKCSKNYWNEVVDIIAKKYNVTNSERINQIKK